MAKTKAEQEATYQYVLDSIRPQRAIQPFTDDERDTMIEEALGASKLRAVLKAFKITRKGIVGRDGMDRRIELRQRLMDAIRIAVENALRPYVCIQRVFGYWRWVADKGGIWSVGWPSTGIRIACSRCDAEYEDVLRFSPPLAEKVTPFKGRLGISLVYREHIDLRKGWYSPPKREGRDRGLTLLCPKCRIAANLELEGTPDSSHFPRSSPIVMLQSSPDVRAQFAKLALHGRAKFHFLKIVFKHPIEVPVAYGFGEPDPTESVLSVDTVTTFYPQPLPNTTEEGYWNVDHANESSGMYRVAYFRPFERDGLKGSRCLTVDVPVDVIESIGIVPFPTSPDARLDS